MTLVAERHSARMSKITIHGLTWSSTRCSIAVPGNSGVKGLVNWESNWTDDENLGMLVILELAGPWTCRNQWSSSSCPWCITALIIRLPGTWWTSIPVSMRPADDIFVLPGVITSLCLDTVSARMASGICCCRPNCLELTERWPAWSVASHWQFETSSWNKY